MPGDFSRACSGRPNPRAALANRLRTGKGLIALRLALRLAFRGGCGALTGFGVGFALRFVLARFFGIRAVPTLTRGGAVVGRIKPRAFEDDAHGQVDLTKGLFIAFGTPGQRLICKFLISFKLHTTVLTPIGINRHTDTSFSKTAILKN